MSQSVETKWVRSCQEQGSGENQKGAGYRTAFGDSENALELEVVLAL